MAEYVNENAPQYSQQRQAKGMPMVRNFGIGGTSTGSTRLLDPDEHKDVSPGKNLGAILKGVANVAAAGFTGGLDALYGTGVYNPKTGKVEKEEEKKEEDKSEEETDIPNEDELKEGKKQSRWMKWLKGPASVAGAGAAATKYKTPLKRKRGAAGTGGYSVASGMGSSTRLAPSARLNFPTPSLRPIGGTSRSKTSDSGSGKSKGGGGPAGHPSININIHDLVKQNIAGGTGGYQIQQKTNAPKEQRSAVGKDFDKAFAIARKLGKTTFEWTHPKTGKKGVYGTNIAKPSKNIQQYTKGQTATNVTQVIY